MIDYKALHEQCRREGKSTLGLDDVAAGHPIAEAELAELRQSRQAQSFGGAEALADWLEGLHETTADGSVCAGKWKPAQIAAQAIREYISPEPDPAAVPERVLFQPKNLAHLGEWYVCEILCYSGEYVVADYCGRPKVWKAKDVVFYRTGDK